MRHRIFNPYCNACGGSGYVKVVPPVRTLGELVTSVAEALIPGMGRTKKCWKCGGSGMYDKYQRRR